MKAALWIASSVLLCGCARDPDGPPAGSRPITTGKGADPKALTSSSAPGSSPNPETRDPCEEIRGARFKSVESFDTGLGPDGPVMGPVTVEFRGEMVSYQVSDTWQSGRYECSQGDISVGNGQIRAHYDAAKGTLIWGGHEFRKVP